MTLPTPEEVLEYFEKRDSYSEVVKSCSFSTQHTRVKLSLDDQKEIYVAIAFYRYLKKHKLTNLHMTYIEKAEALSIYFELDNRLARMMKPHNPVTSAIKEMF